MATSFADLRKRFAKLSTAVANSMQEWQTLQVRGQAKAVELAHQLCPGAFTHLFWSVTQDEACTLCSSCVNMMNRTPVSGPSGPYSLA